MKPACPVFAAYFASFCTLPYLQLQSFALTRQTFSSSGGSLCHSREAQPGVVQRQERTKKQGQRLDQVFASIDQTARESETTQTFLGAEPAAAGGPLRSGAHIPLPVTGI
jgi:hypothetical protein